MAPSGKYAVLNRKVPFLRLIFDDGFITQDTLDHRYEALFTDQMYQGLGPRWAASMPAFLALACIPIPFLLYRYGALIRARCFYAAEADAYLDRMLRVEVREVHEWQDVHCQG